MYAIIQTGGKQYRVEPGKEIYIEKLDIENGESVTFDKVLMINDGESIVGKPYIESATVTGKIEKQGLGKKVVTFKYKPKKHSHTKKGHRQPYTKVTIDAINK